MEPFPLLKSMEPFSFESITTSRPLLFKVGANKREFFIHSGLVASLSKPLCRLVNGPWSESTDAVVMWENVDEATFVLFSQYAYTGDYEWPNTTILGDEGNLLQPAVPEPEPELEEPETEPEEPQTDSFRGAPAYSSASGMRKKDKKKKECFWDNDESSDEDGESSHPLALFPKRFQSVFQQLLAEKQPHTDLADRKPKRVTSEVTKCHSHSDVVLTFARLFIFADCYQIDALAGRALSNLHQSLMTSQVKDSDVVNVTAFCVNTELPQALRTVLLAYIASQASSIWAHDEFQGLIRQDSVMMYELLDMIMKAARMG
ncbi:hypothetical protein NLU13_0257 [Sarocladium strictum]|uniref:BTB domain-containing protein n=1 Tax=Sarocladium strictum TaxID=5046 RepID=A0AA39LBC2_SARSR|nr:hypothetical protein NLU13_0257 [Sarocladium strictum]